MRKFNQALLLILPSLAILVAACTSESLPIGKPAKGETLIISIDQLERAQEIRYQGTDGKHYLVAPTNLDNEFVVLKMNVHNAEATIVQMDVEGDAVRLRGFGNNEEFPVVEVRPRDDANVTVVDTVHPAENRFVPFIIGPLEVPQGNSLIGWIAFELPKGLDIRELRWGAGDIVFLRS